MNSKDNQIKKENKKPKKIGNFIYDFVKVTGAIPTLLWMRPKVICMGKTKPKHIKGGVLITSNHVSFVDPVLIHCVFWRRRLHCLATKNLYDTKLKEFFFTHMHCIKVDKDNFSLASFHEVCNCLKDEKAVVIFPEGQVNRNDEGMLGFKSGAVLMAYKSNKPILPICIIKPKKWYNRRVVLMGDPIDVKAICGNMPTVDDLKKASDYLREKEIELLENYYKKVNKDDT